MMTAGLFYPNEEPADLMCQAASILAFLAEALSGVAAAGPNAELSNEAVEGLAGLCRHLNLVCQEAFKRQASA